MPPVYFFLIDVSYAAVSSGMAATVAGAVKACMDALPGDERTLFGLMTFDRWAQPEYLGSSVVSRLPGGLRCSSGS
jgi:hypothetical protein